MKKSLIALAAMAAVAGSAQAQSSVTIYGIADMAVQAGNRGAGSGTKYALDSGEQGGSRLGFKGTEDLGSGLKAIFALEAGIYMDSGASQGGLTFGRQSWVGLQGDFGTVKMGRQYTPQFYFFDAVDPFDLGFTSGVAGGSTSTGGVFGFLSASSWRVNNSVSYQSNDMSGFSTMALYGFGEVAGNTSANRSVGINGQYAAGPLYVGAVYYKQNDAASNGLKSVLLGATYDFGVAKGAFGYSKDTTDNNTLDQKGYMLGVTVPVTAADNILATAARLQNNLASGANNSTQLAVGFTHSLSKRTNLYGSYSRVRNDANINGGGLAVANGATASLANVGIHHAF
ncbi:porin [Undibacterium oligocarboniphilum]|uniref:Porin n=1 Tax=Undibacterium oligocarboniphilum TaxID=666702 RepID=A0A850QMK5_9BURK|nr:porin [Undibacterium oligocarboniphilum]MBC3869997.1 porin [Undibacterium oligocarboniphilum]NVO77614.1 porin [Undibacterium oligocarboniphilum]